MLFPPYSSLYSYDLWYLKQLKAQNKQLLICYPFVVVAGDDTLSSQCDLCLYKNRERLVS